MVCKVGIIIPHANGNRDCGLQKAKATREIGFFLDKH
jgi:hypothetical protein